MKVTYLKLENVAGLQVGSNINKFELSFDNSNNRIISIEGPNGTGKSVIISSISPFAYVTSLDDRSSLSYIIPKKSGYKEIHYVDGNDLYVIKHYFKPTKESHSVKSYFSKNGEELNENGNVTSFNSLVELHMGLTQDMMRLIRIGSNVNSFITLTPSKRKEYIGKLISELDVYLIIYKKINDDIRVIKTLLQTNGQNLYNCHIDDPLVEESNLEKMRKDIKRYELERDGLISNISKIESLIQNNDILELRRKKQDAEASLREFEKAISIIDSKGLNNVTMDELIKARAAVMEKKIDIQSRINSFRISIDNAHQNIEYMEISIKKVTSNNDIQSLNIAIENIKRDIENATSLIKNFVYLGSTSDEVYSMLVKLQSYNQISKSINTFGNKSIDTYIRLRQNSNNVDHWLKEQSKRMLSMVNKNDVQLLLEKVFEDDYMVTPNCDTEYINCPYFRLHEVIADIKTKVDDESYDDEDLHCIEIISNNIDNIMNDLDHMKNIHIPDAIAMDFTESKIIERLNKRLSFFDLTELQEYLSLLREYEIYQQNCEKLKSLEYQLSMYKKAGIDSQLIEIKHQKDQIEKYQSEIKALDDIIREINKEIETIDSNISIISKFNDSKKYKKMVETTLKDTNKVLEPLENATKEKYELEFQLKHLSNVIASTRDNCRILESKLSEYNKLVEDGKKLDKKFKDLSMILKAVSTKKGIPVLYMKKYLSKIKKLSNELLELIYDGEFSLSKFEVTEDTFEVPYIKNGRKIPDIKYASQSELALGTMALSLALANNSTGHYNILLLDEIDAGLDDKNRTLFLRMLYAQMEKLNAEQVFMVSHNLSQMVNVPMDCIRLGEVSTKTKLQNVIYEL